MEYFAPSFLCIYCGSILTVLHVIVTNNANTREGLEKVVFDIWLKMQMSKVFSVSSP